MGNNGLLGLIWKFIKYFTKNRYDFLNFDPKYLNIKKQLSTRTDKNRKKKILSKSNFSKWFYIRKLDMNNAWWNITKFQEYLYMCALYFLSNFLKF